MKKSLYIIIAILTLTSVANADSIIFPYQGGTGINTVPTYGLVLVGNANGTYTLTATSSLGISGGSGTNYFTNLSTNTYLNTGLNLQSPSLQATSTTATSTFAGNVMVGTSLNNGMVVPGGGLLNAGTSPFQISQNVNDLENTAIIANTNLGAYAATCLSLFNGGSTFNGITSSNYSDLCFTGPNFNSASAPGGGLFLGSQIPGLPANSTVLVNSDGALLFGALSANSASSSMSWSIGPGYAMGNFDMVLKNVGPLATNALNAGLGIGTTSPFARLGISASSTAGYPYLVIASTTNGLSGANSGVFVVNNNGNVGVGTTSPGSLFSVQGNALVFGNLSVTNITASGVLTVAGIVNSSTDTATKYTATGNVASVLPYASTTALTSIGSAYFATTGGAVGIGTTSPFTTLSIGAGGGASSGSILVSEYRPATSTSITVDWKVGNTQLLRIGTSATTIAFSNVTDGQTLKIITCSGQTTTGAISFTDTRILWVNGTVPVQTTTANKCDVYSFIGTMATTTMRVFGAQTPNF